MTSTVSEKWEETDDKPTVVMLLVYGLIGLIAANGVLKSIDGLRCDTYAPSNTPASHTVKLF